MKRSIRKTLAFVHVTYLDGDFANNLYGTNFTVEASDTVFVLSIDVTSNLKNHNKRLNCYQDAHDLIEKHSLVKFIQINEPQIVKGLAYYYNKNPNSTWKLKLIIGSKILEYKVNPQLSNEFLFYIINSQE